MNNRERMKEYVLFAQGAGRRFFATEPIPFMDRTARMLLALIDRVPSEEDVLVEGRALGELSGTADKYHELIMSVETKHTGETRHQTALRYIREREHRKALGIEGKE